MKNRKEQTNRKAWTQNEIQQGRSRKLSIKTFSNFINSRNASRKYCPLLHTEEKLAANSKTAGVVKAILFQPSLKR